MMTSVTTVHLNPVSAEREEEFNLWFSWRTPGWAAPHGTRFWRPELNGLEMAVTNYESMMPRLTEQWPTPRDRAISAIAHILAGLPGFCAGEAYVKKTDVLSPALRENLKRLAAEDAAGGN